MIFASRTAQALAEDLGLDALEIVGTGRGGRVKLADVRAAIPPVPDGLGEHGKGFYLRVRSRYTLRPDEEELLLAACKTLDELRRLEAALAEASPVVPGSRGQSRGNPLVREIRDHRLAFKTLLGTSGIGLDDADEADEAADRARAGTSAARQLANQRWKRRRG